MFTTSSSQSKDNLDEVISIQSVANSLSDIKEELIRDVKKHEFQEISTINRNIRRDLHMGEIQTLTDTLQNRQTEILNAAPVIETERSFELSTFPQTNEAEASTEILDSINNPENALNLDQSHYYDSLNNGPIMVYQMPSGNLVPFDSLVPVPITKTIEDKTNEPVDLLDASYSSNGVYSNSSHPVPQPLYIMSDINKFKNHENEKMLISQIYSADDPNNLFLDSRQTYIRNKCEISMGESITSDLNLAAHSSFDSSIPISSVGDINQFPITATYTSTDTDSEVALTLASLGNLKNEKIQETYNESQRVFDSENIKELSPFNKKDAHSTLILRSRKGKNTVTNSNIQDQMPVLSVNSKKENDVRTELKDEKKENKRRKSRNKSTKGSGVPAKVPLIQTKSSCEPRKENLLGQLLKASKHCEPASLIPEGVVDDVIPAVGYRIMDMSNLTEMIRTMHKCSNASSRGLIVIQEQAFLRKGAVSQLSIICTGCQEGTVCATSNKLQEHSYDINSRVEQLTKEFNVEESQVQRMLEILGIFYRPCDKPPPEANAPPPLEKEDTTNNKKENSGTKNAKKERNIECKVCDKKFFRMNHLKTHMYIHDSGLHTCPYCQAYFKRVFNLREHIKKHKNIKYKCDLCEKSYTDRSTLYAHKKSFHQEIYKIQCEICSKKFFHKTHYVEHLRVHSGEKPFACDICGKRYPYVNCMKKHMRSHCSVANYKCRLCGKWFKLLFGIRQHLFQQHKLKKCDIEAQVKTELIAESVPAYSAQEAFSSQFENANIIKPSFAKVVRNVNNQELEGRRENSGISTNTSTVVVQTLTTSPDMQQPAIFNINDWKKPL